MICLKRACMAWRLEHLTCHSLLSGVGCTNGVLLWMERICNVRDMGTLFDSSRHLGLTLYVVTKICNQV